MVNGNPIIEGFIEAIKLIVTLDPQVVEITLRSLYVSLSATFVATLIALPVGALIYFYEFRGSTRSSPRCRRCMRSLRSSWACSCFSSSQTSVPWGSSVSSTLPRV